MNNRIVTLLCAALLMSACSTVNQVSYLQDAESGYKPVPTRDLAIRLVPGDQVAIIVTCKDPTLTTLFNLPYLSQMIGSTNQGAASGQRICTYLVDSEGNIDFPVAGKIKIAGHSREEVSEIVKNALQEKNLVKDPVVTVEFMNLGVSVMGEVARPGRFAIDQDGLTVLDALAMAGDLTITGKRENVKLIREENGVRQVYVLNLTRAEDVFRSPAFYIRQNDLVYVEPNPMRVRQATVNGNNLLSAPFWISVASLAATITVMVTNLVRSR
ncbi:MAG: polysaccharide export protein [Bacteroidales bacterium]|nr:polysaccharide export protein [Bacteroidales bacterium]